MSKRTSHHCRSLLRDLLTSKVKLKRLKIKVKVPPEPECDYISPVPCPICWEFDSEVKALGEEEKEVLMDLVTVGVPLPLESCAFCEEVLKKMIKLREELEDLETCVRTVIKLNAQRLQDSTAITEDTNEHELQIGDTIMEDGMESTIIKLEVLDPPEFIIKSEEIEIKLEDPGLEWEDEEPQPPHPLEIEAFNNPNNITTTTPSASWSYPSATPSTTNTNTTTSTGAIPPTFQNLWRWTPPPPRPEPEKVVRCPNPNCRIYFAEGFTQALETHVRLAHKDDRPRRPISPPAMPHLPAPQGMRKCWHKDCNFTCSGPNQSATLYKHRATEHPQFLKFGCGFCGAIYAETKYLRTHRKTHVKDESKYEILKCEVCPWKDWARGKDLAEHLKTHTGEM